MVLTIFGRDLREMGTSAAAALAAKEIATLKEELAAFKVPKRVFFVDELPRNPMGKVQKALLRERYANAFTPGA